MHYVFTTTVRNFIVTVQLKKKRERGGGDEYFR